MPPLIGRAGELDRLAVLAGLDGSAAEARAGLVLLSGDAGIGKTRLLAELADRTAEAGRTVAVGHCVDLADSPLPYLPFVEIFAGLIGESDRDRLAGSHPGFAPLVGGRGGTARPPERGALIESAWTVLTELAADRPLLVIIEDVHWADRSSLELISYLLARPSSAPVSIVVSYRSDDLHREHPLRPVLAGWARLRAVQRLDLGPLPEPAVRQLITSLDPARPTEDQVRQLVDRAGGNAFFLEELVAAGADRSGLPDDLAELLIMRVERLTDPGRRVVRAASAAGHSVGYELLGQVTGLPAEELDPALRDATQHQLLVAGEGDRFRFRHGLLAEAIYRDLLPGERNGLHRAFLRALTEQPGAADAELARHALAAGDHDAALPASVRAAEAAAASAGPAEALRHYEVALRLAAERDPADPGPADLAARAGECALAAGLARKAAGIVRDALDRPDLPAADRARLLYVQASVGLQSDQPIDPTVPTAEALALLPADPPTPFRTRLLAMHFLALTMNYRDEEALTVAEEAAALAQRFDLPDALVAIRTAQSWAASLHGDPAAVRNPLREAAELARARNDPAELRARYNLGGLAMEDGDLPEALGYYRDTARRGAELGQPYAPFALEGRTHAGIVAYQLGDWEIVRELSDTTGEAPPEPARAALASVGMQVAVGRGERTGPWLDASRAAWHTDGESIMLSTASAIDGHGAEGKLAAAERIHDEGVAAIKKLWQVDDFQGEIRLAALLIGQYANGLHRLDPADREPATVRLAGLAERAATAHGRGRHGRVLGPEGRAWLARLAAESLRLHWLADLDRPDPAALIEAWEAALAGFREYPHRFEQARTEARLAALLRATGDRPRADQLARSARRTGEELGAAPLLAELTATMPTKPGSTGQLLTAREREVLALVAEGNSNSQVAKALVISTKTASVHVSNILAKLGAASRTEAAAVARRRGLLD